MAFIALQDVSTAYDGVPMLRNVDMTVEKGELVCLLGPNGAGKTTTFRAITGLVRPTTGTVRLMDQDIARTGTEKVASLGVGLVPEARRLFPKLTVRENLQLGYEAVGADLPFEEGLESVTARFPRIKERLQQMAGTLSGGEQAMVALARALIARPGLVIMDEPSLGLSPVLIQEYFAQTAEVAAAGTTVLLIEQNAEQALRIADRGYVLVKGRIAASGSASELRESDTVRDLYF